MGFSPGTFTDLDHKEWDIEISFGRIIISEATGIKILMELDYENSRKLCTHINTALYTVSEEAF